MITYGQNHCQCSRYHQRQAYFHTVSKKIQLYLTLFNNFSSLNVPKNCDFNFGSDIQHIVFVCLFYFLKLIKLVEESKMLHTDI